ncbi:MMPL family transporter [Nocardia sp. NPDC048505]|uniref:MMPL family transporter n=1 Tax=unclassified Nocardia TaxID=2637762 RepID=UPI0033CDA869
MVAVDESGPPTTASAPAPRGIVARLATAASRAPRVTLVLAAVLVALCGALGGSLTGKLSAGGFLDADSESSRAARVLTDNFGLTGMQMVLLVTAPETATADTVPAAGREIVAELRADPDVAGAQGPWDGGPATLIGTDGRTAAIIVNLRGDDNTAMNTAHRLAERYIGKRAGAEVTAGGQALTFYDVNKIATADVARAELITVPLSLLLLALLLRSGIGAAIPVVSGVIAIAGTVGILALLALAAEVSVFALNVTMAMGLALSIDYSLLIINRFREFLDDGLDRPAAIVAAVATSGRAVLFSGLTVALSLAGAMFFPMTFLRSIAIAGIAVVGLSVLLALTCVPAMLALFGDRIERNRRRGGPIEETRFYRLARFAQRRAVPVTAVIVLTLLALGLPLRDIQLGLPDDRVLPADTGVHAVGDAVREDFALQAAGTIYLALPEVRPESVAAVREYAARLSALDGAAGVSGSLGEYAAGVGRSVLDPVLPGPAYLAVLTPHDPHSEEGERLLSAVHAVAAPTEVLVGGLGQQSRDTAEGIAAALGPALAWIVGSTLLLLLLLTGSVLLPIKAVVLNLLSLSASFGALVWIFQEGHLGGLGTEATGVTIATVPIVLFCSAFGLSMDYEVFLLSRFQEEWRRRNGRTRADNDAAVAVGTARSGRVITAAALVMVVAFAGTITSEVAIIRAVGVGLTLAVLIDATLIRLLLVPAVMRLAGAWNWWTPAPLRSLSARFEITH